MQGPFSRGRAQWRVHTDASEHPATRGVEATTAGGSRQTELSRLSDGRRLFQRKPRPSRGSPRSGCPPFVILHLLGRSRRASSIECLLDWSESLMVLNAAAPEAVTRFAYPQGEVVQTSPQARAPQGRTAEFLAVIDDTSRSWPPSPPLAGRPPTLRTERRRWSNERYHGNHRS